ncbi:MAG TPA: hypothetical protein VMF03_21920 [Steroidobacteraceae bacterium]|nr:hypothetical protein [Steroidobacteraceae bacterium]
MRLTGAAYAGRMAAVAALLMVAAGGARAQEPGQPSALYPACNRTCLIGVLHSYLDALGHKDRGLAPFARDVRYTENDVEMPLGEGLWGSIGGLSATGLEVADPSTGNAAWFGTVQEHGQGAFLALRLKVADGRITEVESVIQRRPTHPAPFGDPAKLQHDPAFQEVLPPEQRRERPRLEAIANGYFSTVEENDGQIFTYFDPDCQRTENGISTTSGTQGAAAISQGCESQFKLGIYRINKRVRERRYPIIDEERGIVVATGFFDHANTFDSYKTTDGKVHATALKWPNSISLMEAFKIRNGLIYRVEADFTYVPYFMHNPYAWPPAAGMPGSLVAAGPSPQAAGASGEDGSPCDRGCLSALANTYMDALAAHDPGRVPWAARVRYTENNVAMMIGDGVWGAATARDQNPLLLADTHSGTVGWYGTIAEHGQLSYYAMRMKVDHHKVSEVEAIIDRKGDSGPFGDPAHYTHDAAFTTTLPAGERSSRAAMIALVDGYFSTIQKNNGVLHTRFDPQCAREENGQITTNGSFGSDAQGCEAQFKLGTFLFVDRARDRRFTLVDEERGVVMAEASFDHGAKFEDYRTTDGKAARNPITSPSTISLIETFKIRRGRIYRIEAVFTGVPYRMSSQWVTGSGK